MTIAVWPAEMPVPIVDSYARSRTDNRIAGSNNVGVPRFSRGGSQASRPLALHMRCDVNELARFERFLPGLREVTLDPVIMP